MRYLVMGHGNIAKTMMAIIESLGEEWDITTCDIKDGVRGEDLIINDHDKFDVVVNLTAESCRPILELCDRYGLTYIDAGYEFDEDKRVLPQHEDFLDFLQHKEGALHLFGFGMNPGVTELIPVLFGPDHPYIGCEFETDLPVAGGGDRDKVYGTWSPHTYFHETAIEDGFVSSKTDHFRVMPFNDKILDIKTKDGEYKYCVTYHEEVFSIVDENPYCEGSAFIFHAPENLMRYALDNVGDLTYPGVAEIPTKNDLDGNESVGVIFYDGSDNIRYVVNRADHRACYEKFGFNATSWQTACGVYIAMCLAGTVEKGQSLTFSRAAYKYKDQILEILKKLDFGFEEIDYFMEKSEFEEKILPFFDQECIRKFRKQ